MSATTPRSAMHPVRRATGLGRVVGTGLAATVAAMAATTLGALAARAVGVTFEVSGGETIPPSGVGVVTAFFSLVGVGIAAVLWRWSSRPADRFLRTTVTLTAVSLVPPFLAGAAPATVVALVCLTSWRRR